MANTNIANAAPTGQELNKQEAFFLKFRKQILIAVAALIIVVGGWAAYSNLVAGPREEKASTALAKAQDLFGQGEFQKALNGDKTMEGLRTMVAQMLLTLLRLMLACATLIWQSGKRLLHTSRTSLHVRI